MRVSPAQIKADRLLAEWQKTLKLRDWDIAVEVPEKNIESQGSCLFYPSVRQARITLCHPRYKPKETITLWDMEVTIVHELLHVKFNCVPLNKGETHLNEFEAAIDGTAQILVNLKRAGIKPSAAHCAVKQKRKVVTK
jgi:hypothetical protein